MKKESRIRLGEVSIVVLKIIGAAGLVPAVMVAPGVAVALKYFPNDKYYKQKQWHIKNKTLKRLHNQGLIYVVEKDGKKMFGLTEKGQKELAKRKRINVETGIKPKKWDKKWRVIIFDIPEDKRVKRDMLRHALRDFGFVKLQQSVWVFPYDCKDLVMLLRADYKLGKEVLVMTVSEIEESKWIEKKFKL